MPVFAALSVEDEVQERAKYIEEARKRRIIELRRMERERAKEMLSRFKAASAQNQQQQTQFIQELSLYEQKKRVQQELREIEELLRTADANQEAAGVRARAHSMARSRTKDIYERRRSALDRGNNALQLLQAQKQIDTERLERKEKTRLQTRQVEDIRARQAVLIARARELERRLALEKDQYNKSKEDKPYAIVEVTKDNYIPLLANRNKSTAKIPGFQILSDSPSDENSLNNDPEQVYHKSAFLAAEATKNMARKAAIESAENRARAEKVVRDELRKTVKEKETAKVADEAIRLLYTLSK
ncbi:Hypothetical protein GLP15_3832 [Giardia lamblia P15]|uniref:Uncharacterized protein n=1 Tax=Giardia intestinalis (strain P15) TaxID=658858 RepID=E1F9F1_GIAIA|nr:Hypothetical protein GLP15_3832 [Giardia lamblia P15]